MKSSDKWLKKAKTEEAKFRRLVDRRDNVQEFAYAGARTRTAEWKRLDRLAAQSQARMQNYFQKVYEASHKGNPGGRMTKAQKRERTRKASVQRRVAVALAKFLKQANPAMKTAGAKVQKLKGGVIKITPIRRNAAGGNVYEIYTRVGKSGTWHKEGQVRASSVGGALKQWPRETGRTRRAVLVHKGSR